MLYHVSMNNNEGIYSPEFAIHHASMTFYVKQASNVSAKMLKGLKKNPPVEITEKQHGQYRLLLIRALTETRSVLSFTEDHRLTQEELDSVSDSTGDSTLLKPSPKLSRACAIKLSRLYVDELKRMYDVDFKISLT